MPIPVLNVLFAKDPRTEITGAPQEIPVDAVISRSTEFSSSVTSAPVEDGTSINDHVVLDPVSLQIDGFTSDHPVDLLEGLSSAVGAVGEILGLGSGETRSQTAAKALEEAWRSKSLLEIVTRRRTYKNMVIERLSFSESQEIGDALSFTMQVTEIRKVSLVTVPASGLASAAADLASGAVDRGRQPAKPRPAASPGVTSLSQAASLAA